MSSQQFKALTENLPMTTEPDSDQIRTIPYPQTDTSFTEILKQAQKEDPAIQAIIDLLSMKQRRKEELKQRKQDN
jgi:hypothetical protein